MAHFPWDSRRIVKRVAGITSNASSTTSGVKDLELQIKNVSARPVYGACLSIRFYNLTANGEIVVGRVLIGQPFSRATDAVNPSGFSLQPNATMLARIPAANALGIDAAIAGLPGGSAGVASIRLEAVTFGSGLGWDNGAIVSGPDRVVMDRAIDTGAGCGGTHSTQLDPYPQCTQCAFLSYTRTSADGNEVIRGGSCRFTVGGASYSCPQDQLVDCRFQDQPTAENGGSIWDYIQVVYNL